MKTSHIWAFFVRLTGQSQQNQETLPAYSTLATSPKDSIGNSIDTESLGEDSSFDGCPIDRRQSAVVPRLSQFLSHFTLGFADGLTVPFALTAGLSSLGQTQTVIYAGMAEICAGCISMGISGYLAAEGETSMEMNLDNHNEKLKEADEDAIQRYLAVMDLPPDLLQGVKAHIDYHPSVSRRLLNNLKSTGDDKAREFPPWVIGLSISLGYLIGGMLPLFPYFFVNKVGDGLQWSFVVCLLALFVFGFAKNYLLHNGSVGDGWQHGDARKSVARWKRFQESWWEGMRMVVMGGLAAVAAVLCVKLFEGVMS
ncbi:DUF125-domain-containing protein [Hypoxylon trugodes]|uniref:DUF125-domain-containing protein n=1 Tax=Hypoxylon trugodes TaxID=326681 RepID=UPI0021A00F45|nr:DUF125-domain-containing protein [Hypoxylon trugodes]KAI1384368.1 DUF125-domain-containing protein [Hypoxylon trugodes]